MKFGDKLIELRKKNGLKEQYNAIDDTIKYEEENYSCIKELEKTEYGDRIIYTCDYK